MPYIFGTGSPACGQYRRGCYAATCRQHQGGGPLTNNGLAANNVRPRKHVLQCHSSPINILKAFVILYHQGILSSPFTDCLCARVNYNTDIIALVPPGNIIFSSQTIVFISIISFILLQYINS